MIRVDGTRLRKKAQRDYQKALRDLDSAKAQLAAFHECDEPLFSRWRSTHFGALLTEIRELQTRLFELQQLVEEVEQEYFFGGHRSMAGAYREVLRRRAQPEMPEDAAADPDEEDDFAREFEDAFKEAAEEFWERITGESSQGRQPPQPALRKTKAGGSRLKELYRTLARRLHPDKAAELSPREKEWWHQTQDAYETGNLEQMEMILTLVEIEDNGTRETSVSALAKLTASFKQGLRALKRAISKLRHEPAWNFSARSDHSCLFAEIQHSLQSDRQRLASLLGMYQGQISRWEREPVSSLKRSRSRRRVPDDPDELFL